MCTYLSIPVQVCASRYVHPGAYLPTSVSIGGHGIDASIAVQRVCPFQGLCASLRVVSIFKSALSVH